MLFFHGHLNEKGFMLPPEGYSKAKMVKFANPNDPFIDLNKSLVKQVSCQ